MYKPSDHIFDLPNELLLQILRVTDDELCDIYMPLQYKDQKLAIKRLGVLRLVCKRTAAIGLDIVLPLLSLHRHTDCVGYKTSERSLAMIEAISRNAKLAALITRLICSGHHYDLATMVRAGCSGQCDNHNSMDPGRHELKCPLTESHRIRSFYIAECRFVGRGNAAERLRKALPRFPNLRKLVYDRRLGSHFTRDVPGTQHSIKSSELNAYLLPISSLHGWTGIVDIARALGARPNRIDTLEMLGVLPDMSTCALEERAVLHRFVKTTPALRTLLMHPLKLVPWNVGLFARLPATKPAEARLWIDLLGEMVHLQTLEVRSYDHVDDKDLEDASIIRLLLTMQWPRLQTLRLKGMGVYHDALMSFLLRHRQTLTDIELLDCHTIVSAGPLSQVYNYHEYIECVYGDWVECATLLWAMRRRGALRTVSVEFEPLVLERLTEENGRLFEGLQPSGLRKKGSHDFTDALMRYCAREPRMWKGADDWMMESVKTE